MEFHLQNPRNQTHLFPRSFLQLRLFTLLLPGHYYMTLRAKRLFSSCGILASNKKVAMIAFLESGTHTKYDFNSIISFIQSTKY